MSFVWLIVLMFVTLFCGLVGSGTNEIAAVCAVLFFICSAVLYFWPAGLAMLRDHPNKVSVAVTNVFLGWTFLGWVIALVWAYKREPLAQATTANVQNAPAEPTSTKVGEGDTRRCPFCAEDVKAAAIKCKHCGSDLSTTSMPGAA